MQNIDSTRVTLRNVRLSYTHLDKPYSSQPGQEAKYSATVLVPKNPANNKALMDAAIRAATAKALEKWGKAFPASPKISVHDGDGVRPSDGQPFSEECKGCWVFTASSKTPVPIVDLNLQPILDATQIYSGMYANVGVSFFGYNAPQNKGVGVGLEAVQKTADGEMLGGQRASAEDIFGVPAAEPQVTAPYIPPYQQAPAAPQYQQPVYAPAPQPQTYQAIDPITGLPL